VKIVIIGCGILGATLAYELSRHPGRQVFVLESNAHPAAEATGAALGLLMGVISQKTKGRAWQWRQTGLQYYQQLLPKLASIGQPVFHNTQGLFKLIPDPADLAKWQSLVTTRTTQGWPLEIWSQQQISEHFPWLQISEQTQAIYSPADWQIHPAQITRALVTMATQQGVQFQWQTPVSQITSDGVKTVTGFVAADRIIITAGMGSSILTSNLQQPIELMPVLGQAIHCRLLNADLAMHPVITRNDVHLVPLGQKEYWVGATVEFPPESWLNTTVIAQEEYLTALWQQAIDYFPALATAEILTTWSGLRPRPVGRPAPVIEKIAGYPNVIVATGHYRNGVLLAPATARMVQELL
jgi:glycine oxidase